MSVEKHSEPKTTFAGAALWYSKVVRAGDFYFVSGQPGADPQLGIGQGDARAQTLQAFRNLDLALQGVGLTLDDVIKVTVYLADPRDFMWMNLGMQEVFPGQPPARVTVCAQPVLDTKIEVEAVAYRQAECRPDDQ